MGRKLRIGQVNLNLNNIKIVDMWSVVDVSPVQIQEAAALSEP